MRPAKLVLEDGRAFAGRRCGDERNVATGEVVFNTAMSGYQEVLTDPSYSQQLVAMTAPMIGNIGMAAEDDESEGAVPCSALIVKEISRVASNWRSVQSLPDYLLARRIVGLTEVDTRSLVQHLRSRGALRGAIVDAQVTMEEAQAQARSVDLGRDLVAACSCQSPYTWEQGEPRMGDPPLGLAAKLPVVVVDYGVKRNILRCLVDAGCAVTVVPAKMPAADILARRPAGVLLSNGPGDPRALHYGVAQARALLGKLPLLGICLGHQLLALALGGQCSKLKFGHHGSNHPVQEQATGRAFVTAQNHGYTVDPASLPAMARCTHVNLIDQTLAGFAVPDAQAWGLQFHPEGAPGPHEGRTPLHTFVAAMAAAQEAAHA